VVLKPYRILYIADVSAFLTRDFLTAFTTSCDLFPPPT